MTSSRRLVAFLESNSVRNGAAVARIVATNTIYEYTRVLILKLVGDSIVRRTMGILALLVIVLGFVLLQVRAYNLGGSLRGSGLGFTFTSTVLHLMGLLVPIFVLFQVAVSQGAIAVVRRNVSVFPISVALVSVISYLPFLLPTAVLFLAGLFTVLMVVIGVGEPLGMWGVPLLLGLAGTSASATIVQMASYGSSRLLKSSFPASTRALFTLIVVAGWILGGWRLLPDDQTGSGLTESVLSFHTKGVLGRLEEYAGTDLVLSGSVLIVVVAIWMLLARTTRASSRGSQSARLSPDISKSRTMKRSGRPLIAHLVGLSTRNSPIWLEFIVYAGFSVAVVFFAVLLDRRGMDSESASAMFVAGFLVTFSCMGIFGSVSPLAQLQRLGLRGQDWLKRVYGIKLLWILLGVVAPLIYFANSGIERWFEPVIMYLFGCFTGFVSVSIFGFYLKDIISTTHGRMACSVVMGLSALLIVLLGITSNGFSISFILGCILLALLFVAWYRLARRAVK